MEAAISSLLPPAPGASAGRDRLLMHLAEYADLVIHQAAALGAITPGKDACGRALEWLLRPVFICGHQRSGTTLLQNLLDGHPELLSLPSEGTYFGSFAYVARHNDSKRYLERFAAEWIKRFIDPNFEPHFRIGRSDADHSPSVDFVRMLFGWHAALRLQVEPNLSPLVALVAAFKQTTAPAGAPRLWVEKTPQNERCIARFAFFKEARFIHMVRDPRATFASLREIYRTRNIGQFDAPSYARKIRRSLRLAQANAHRFSNRYLIVRYEDLVDRPTLEIERVRTFLAIASDPILLVPTAGGHPVAANSSFTKTPPGAIERFSRSTMSSIACNTTLSAYAADAARPFGSTCRASMPSRRGLPGLPIGRTAPFEYRALGCDG